MPNSQDRTSSKAWERNRTHAVSKINQGWENAGIYE